jgi:alkylation response protein AidB-like acyl-CoA dehydrogenase
MDFDFTDEQQQLRDAVARFVEKGYGFERRRATEKAGGFSAEAWAELSELGLPGIAISADGGGIGFGPVECMVVMEELGRGIVLEPVLQAFISGPVLEAFGPAALKAAWLPKMASGEAIVSLAHVERKGRYNLAHCEAKATAQGGSFALSGTKIAVPAGGAAAAYLVPAQLDGKIALFLVERQAAGVQAAAHTGWCGAQLAHVNFANAAAHLVTTEGAAALDLAVDIGVAGLCAEAVGVMDRAVAITGEYLNTRKQFGVTIASFQALRHRFADVKMQLELARSMSYYAALKLGAAPDERRMAMARAKVQLGRSMRQVAQEAVQMHGGIGCTDEYIISHYFRKLTAMEMQFGDTLHHLGEVSARMGEQAGVFA